jgi:hypothetical protein
VLFFLRASVPPDRTSAGADDLALLLAEAGHAGSAYRELPAALRAYLAGDHLPFDRLMNEAAVGRFGNGPAATSDSQGLFLAVTCADWPQPFDLRAPLSVQERQLNAAYKSVVASSARTFLPFTPQEALTRAGGLCLGWPAPTNPPLRSLRETFPNVPTLVLEGGLDTVTPPPVARGVADLFRNSRYVEVPFVGHVAALDDNTGCAASIVATFIASNTIHSACLSRIRAPLQIEAFPLTFAQETPITPIDAHGTTGISANDLRTIAIARDTISDVMWRWGPLGFVSRRGLRGGSFTASAPFRNGDYSVHLNAIRWTADTSVTGFLFTSPTAYTLIGNVVVTTPTGRTQLEIQSPDILPPSTEETISGTFGGRAIDITVDAKLGP